MEAAGWIVIPNWRRFQHYKDRNPKWVKVYTELMSDPAYLALTLHQRGVLHGLWMEYARAHRQIPDSTSTVSRRLGGRVSRATLDALNHAGFIEVSASAPLAEVEHSARPELSTSYLTKSGDARAVAPGGAPSPAEKTQARRDRRDKRRRYDDLLAAADKYTHDWDGGTSDAFDAGLDELERLASCHLQAGDRYRLWDQAWQMAGSSAVREQEA